MEADKLIVYACWKMRVIAYYKKHGCLDEEMCAWGWDTYEDMISALQFMKHQLNVNKFTSAMYEDLIRS